jgi:hypothetical protein
MNPIPYLSLRIVRCAALAAIGLALFAPDVRAATGTLIVAPFASTAVGDTSVAHAVDLEFFQFDLVFDPLIVQADTSGTLAGAGC